LLNVAGFVVMTVFLYPDGCFFKGGFLNLPQKKRPYIILKWAQSAEGFLAQADRSRCQLSNVFSSRLVHKWRTEESAIMVGFRTLMQDNPQLTARFWQGFQPLRIVLDKDLRVPEDYHVFNADAPTWIINQHRDEVQNNVRWLQLPFDTGLLNALLSKLYEAGKLSLIVEGGAVLLQHFINQGLWDEARVFHTPVSLPQGISAPVLTEAQLSCSAEVHTDTLQIFYPNHGVDSGIIYQ
jgi:diaminohydroxyphosphoribosylaminopyrimidine deaminase/5-amino-6-(5-phosphoribosylamino)uracil reductase